MGSIAAPGGAPASNENISEFVGKSESVAVAVKLNDVLDASPCVAVAEMVGVEGALFFFDSSTAAVTPPAAAAPIQIHFFDPPLPPAPVAPVACDPTSVFAVVLGVSLT